MTTPETFAPGYRLTDGDRLNLRIANPQWSTTQTVAATPGGTMQTSVKVVNAITNVTTASIPGASITLPQALVGTVLLVINSTNNDIRVFSDGDSTISGLSGLVGVLVARNSFGFFAANATKEWSYGNFYETTGSRSGTGPLVCQNNATINTPTINDPTVNDGTFTNSTFVTPDLGVATATSINKVTITQPATGATLTLADNSTLETQGDLTFPPNGGAGENGYVLKTDGSGTLSWDQLTAADVVNVPAGSIAATDVQAALNELDTEKLAANFVQLYGTGQSTRTYQSKVSDFVNGLDFGMVGDGVTDNTTAFNNAMAAAALCPTRTLFVPAGQFLFSSAPNSLPRIKLIGAGSQSSVLTRGYVESTDRGLLDIQPGTGNGTIIEGFAINAGVGSSGGSVISAIANSAQGVSDFTISNMYITPGAVTDAFVYMLYFNGTQKSTGAIGNRGIRLYGLTLFGTSYASAYFAGCEGLCWNGGNANAAGGTGLYSGGIQIDGTSAVPSNYTIIDVANINGAINLNYCNDASIRTTSIGALGGVSVWNSANTNNTRIRYTSLAGSVQSNWTNSGAATA